MIQNDIKKPDKEALISMLDEMIQSFDNMPPHAMVTPINHYDLSSLMILLSALFKVDNEAI